MASYVAALPERTANATASSTDFLVVGAGVAGAVAARRLVERGYRVRVIDSGPGASHAPAAVVNPVRAKRGKPVPDAARKLSEAFHLYRRFTRIEPGLVHLVPPEERPRWERALKGSGLEYRWVDGRLLLPGAFWLRPRRLLAALLAGIPRVRDRVVLPEAGGVWLSSGRFLKGTVIWAGGAEGARALDPAPALVAGSLLLIAEVGRGTIHRIFHAGTAVGGSYRPIPRFCHPAPTNAEISELIRGATRLLGHPPTAIGVWSGVRYRRPDPVGEAPWGLFFTGFGSTGLLNAPLASLELLRLL